MLGWIDNSFSHPSIEFVSINFLEGSIHRYIQGLKYASHVLREEHNVYLLIFKFLVHLKVCTKRINDKKNWFTEKLRCCSGKDMFFDELFSNDFTPHDCYIHINFGFFRGHLSVFLKL